MKKLLWSSIVLSFLAISMFAFQISCKKDAIAQSQTQSKYTLPPATQSTLGGVIVGNGLKVTNNGTLSVVFSNNDNPKSNKLIYSKIVNRNSDTNFRLEIWMVNYDGSDNKEININLPSGIEFTEDMFPVLSPDGKKILFTAGPSDNSDKGDIYSCDIDGSNVTKILDSGGEHNYIIITGN